MRILCEIPHPYLKITVFKYEGRISIKINHLVYETILRFRDGEILDEQLFIESLPNSDFINEMEKSIHNIHQSRMKLLKKHDESF